MRAALFDSPGSPLRLADIEQPSPGPHEVLLRNRVCAVCRTDLHIVDGDLEVPLTPLIPGHQIVAEVAEVGDEVKNIQVGDRMGVPWLGKTCGHCNFCVNEQENLCDTARFTGLHINGGFAEYSIADSRFCFSMDSSLDDLQLAPLLCGGLIGYRAYRMIGDAKKVGFYGFGSAAHILLQLAVYEDRKVFAFTRDGDSKTQLFARQMGAYWAGGSGDHPPEPLDAAIIFAPVGELVPVALRTIQKGGIVVCAGIHMSDIPSMPYELLWGERTVRSVANLTRRDGWEFLELAAKIPVQTSVRSYPLEKVNQALNDLRDGKFNGSAVILL
ncbi:MAG: zinc-dependent alcohol dehydrogenase family protein [Gammaproteobacteria bacterium]|nr:zinc-dependent alcohol dehydrogenase family protein [Gammaproteobacteria bacterium]